MVECGGLENHGVRWIAIGLTFLIHGVMTTLPKERYYKDGRVAVRGFAITAPAVITLTQSAPLAGEHTPERVRIHPDLSAPVGATVEGKTIWRGGRVVECGGLENH